MSEGQGDARGGISGLIGLVSLGLAIAAIVVATQHEDDIFCNHIFPDGKTTLSVHTAVGSGSTAGSVNGDVSMKDPSSLIKNIGINRWLLIHGIFGLVAIPLVICAICSMAAGEGESGGTGAAAGGCAILLIVLVGLFRICWLCVGAALLWGNCHGSVGPDPVYNTMIACIIVGFIELVVGCLQKSRGNRGAGGDYDNLA